jgi:hypothetical protein
MSAFIASPRLYGRVYARMSADAGFDQRHATRKLAAAATEWRRPEDEDDMRPAVMRGLYELNVKAVNHRYGEDTDCQLPPAYRAAFGSNLITAPDYLKALQCLHYQMSEGAEVPAHPLYKAVEFAIGALAQHIAERSLEYAAADWD